MASEQWSDRKSILGQLNRRQMGEPTLPLKTTKKLRHCLHQHQERTQATHLVTETIVSALEHRLLRRCGFGISLPVRTTHNPCEEFGQMKQMIKRQQTKRSSMPPRPPQRSDSKAKKWKAAVEVTSKRLYFQRWTNTVRGRPFRPFQQPKGTTTSQHRA